MKIKNKLTLLFTLVVAVLMLVLNVYIFLLSKSYAKTDFFKHLKERAFITGNVFLEEDESSQKVYKEYQDRYLEKLPGEVTRVYNSQDRQVFSGDSAVSFFTPALIHKTRQDGEFELKTGDRYFCGIFYADNQGEYVILASAVDLTGDAKLKNLFTVLTLGFLAGVVIVYFLGNFFTKQMLTPVSAIVNQVNRIKESNLHLRLDEGNGKDEIAELARTFNHVLARLENAFELQRNFVANASHEFRTPLTSIIGNIDVTLSRERTVEEYKIILHTVLEEAERMHKLSDGLLHMAQASLDAGAWNAEGFRLDELLEEAKDIVASQIAGSTFDLAYTNLPLQSDELIIQGNRNLLLIAFENLLENAAKFSNNQPVTVTLANFSDAWEVAVRDAGVGIPEKELSRVPQIFYRSENARPFSGSGIGLSLSQKIIGLHQGKIELDSIEGKGTTVRVHLPKIK